MKRILTFILVAASFLAAENSADAQFLKNLANKLKGKSSETTTTTTDQTASEATINGKTAGVALRALFTQYKADGKLDMGNVNNLLNLTALANNIQGLKGQTNKTAYYKDFASGLVTGSDNLVSDENSSSVVDGLKNLVEDVDLSALSEKAGATATTVSEKVATASEKASTAASNVSDIAGAVTNILNIFKK